MFVDTAHIVVQGGKGGNGKIMRYSKVAYGESGGWGGRGGNVYAVTNRSISDLKEYAGTRKYRAHDGEDGGQNRMGGKEGTDITLHFPPGTEIIDKDSGESWEITTQPTLICSGGEGGHGARIRIQQGANFPIPGSKGKEGKKRNLYINQKIIADIGIIGLPNAGKSSLLNALTNAEAKIADYAFTTLVPNLGALEKIIIADIPGLIEGASSGKGLGIRFLKHTEKVRLLVHCISLESKDPLADYKTVKSEMEKFNKNLANKKEIIVVTKTDLSSPKEIKQKTKQLLHLGIEILSASVYNQEEINIVKQRLTEIFNEVSASQEKELEAE